MANTRPLVQPYWDRGMGEKNDLKLFTHTSFSQVPAAGGFYFLQGIRLLPLCVFFVVIFSARFFFLRHAPELLFYLSCDHGLNHTTTS